MAPSTSDFSMPMANIRNLCGTRRDEKAADLLFRQARFLHGLLLCNPCRSLHGRQKRQNVVAEIREADAD